MAERESKRLDQIQQANLKASKDSRGYDKLVGKINFDEISKRKNGVSISVKKESLAQSGEFLSTFGKKSPDPKYQGIRKPTVLQSSLNYNPITMAEHPSTTALPDFGNGGTD